MSSENPFINQITLYRDLDALAEELWSALESFASGPVDPIIKRLFQLQWINSTQRGKFSTLYDWRTELELTPEQTAVIDKLDLYNRAVEARKKAVFFLQLAGVKFFEVSGHHYWQYRRETSELFDWDDDAIENAFYTLDELGDPDRYDEEN